MADPAGLGYRRILFVTDFSDQARGAFDYAVSFARAFAAKIDVLHVLALHAGDRATAEEQLPKVVPQDARDVVASTRMERAISADVGILHAAREMKADLIVLGTHGRTGLKHVFLGSVAERVVQLADCPVLTVRPRDHAFERL